MKISAFLWWSFWTLVVIPLHTRGYVPLVPNSPHCPSCCAAFQSHTPVNSPNKSPTRDPCNCAICNLTAILTTPPAPILLTLNLTRTPFTAPLALKLFHSATTPRTILCRGPPISV